MSTVRVYGPHGEALNPCHPARARQLLRNRRATVVSKRPYTIRLNAPPEGAEAVSTPPPESPGIGGGHVHDA